MKESLRPGEIPQRLYSIITGFTCTDIYLSGRKSHNDVNFPDNFERRFPGGLFFADNPLEKVQNTYPKVKLTLKHSPNLNLTICNPNCFELLGPFESIFPRLPYIAYNISERARQEMLCMSTLHAAAISTPDGRSLLILGDKGSGKTSLTLALCLNYGFRLIGNDLVLVKNQGDKLFIPSGTQIFDIREGVINSFFPELREWISNQESNNPYENKISLIPEQIGISPGQDLQGLFAVIRINLHPKNRETKIEEGARRKEEILRLRENLARYIRGLTTPLVLNKEGFGGYFPSIDSQELSDMRDETIERIISNNFMYVYGDSPKTVVEEIVCRLSLL